MFAHLRVHTWQCYNCNMILRKRLFIFIQGWLTQTLVSLYHCSLLSLFTGTDIIFANITIISCHYFYNTDLFLSSLLPSLLFLLHIYLISYLLSIFFSFYKATLLIFHFFKPSLVSVARFCHLLVLRQYGGFKSANSNRIFYP